MKKKIVAFLLAGVLSVVTIPMEVSAATAYAHIAVANQGDHTMRFDINGYTNAFYFDKNFSYWFEGMYKNGKDWTVGYDKKHDFKIIVYNSNKKSSKKTYSKTSNNRSVSITHTGDWVMYECDIYK